MLLTLSGWTSARIAEAFGVREDTVRSWRSDFARSDFAHGGVAALEARVAAGPVPLKAEAALRVVRPLLEEPVADRPNWTLARLSGEVARREGVDTSRSQSSKVLRKKRPLATAAALLEEPAGCRGGRACRPAASVAQGTGRGRRHRAAVCRRERGAAHPYRARAWAWAWAWAWARAWAERGADLRVPAPGQAKKVAMIGAIDPIGRRRVVHTSPTKRSADFIALLHKRDAPYGPRPGVPTKPVAIVLDNGPIHIGKATTAAPAVRADWLIVEWLPKYAPELNDIERVWHDLKAHNLAHQTFADAQRPSTAPSIRPSRL